MEQDIKNISEIQDLFKLKWELTEDKKHFLNKYKTVWNQSEIIYIILDRDKIFSLRVKGFLERQLDTQPKVKSFKSPWQTELQKDLYTVQEVKW